MANNRILIVDDDPGFVEAFRMTLEARNYEVISTSGDAQLRDEIDSVQPGIVILGTLFPAGQAFATQQWLKQHPRYKDIPLLVIGAAQGEESIHGWRRYEGMQLISDDYLTKPVEPTVLVPRIQSLLERTVNRIKVLVADDHTMVRDGICAVLSLQKEVDIVGEAVNGQEAFDKALRLLPNVILMDIVMPVMSGLEATRRIARECPQSNVLILTQYDEEENMLVAKQAGARGFIPKRAASADLITGIKSVFAGKYFPQSFAVISAN